jgi:hypothetical protein
MPRRANLAAKLLLIAVGMVVMLLIVGAAQLIRGPRHDPRALRLVVYDPPAPPIVDDGAPPEARREFARLAAYPGPANGPFAGRVMSDCRVRRYDVLTPAAAEDGSDIEGQASAALADLSATQINCLFGKANADVRVKIEDAPR